MEMTFRFSICHLCIEAAFFNFFDKGVSNWPNVSVREYITKIGHRDWCLWSPYIAWVFMFTNDGYRDIAGISV